MRGHILTRKTAEAAKPTEPEKLSSGCRKRRRRGERDQQSHCHCGILLRTRRGVTTCLIHGQLWSKFFVGEKHWPEET
jgi:hypothetical protein